VTLSLVEAGALDKTLRTIMSQTEAIEMKLHEWIEPHSPP
jgi:hypothetical protein